MQLDAQTPYYKLKYVDFKMCEEKLFFISTKWQSTAIFQILVLSTIVPFSSSLMFLYHILVFTKAQVQRFLSVFKTKRSEDNDDESNSPKHVMF
jgi:hypothetical protein